MGQRRRRAPERPHEASGSERRSVASAREDEATYVHAYVECMYVEGMCEGERGRNDQWGGDGRGDRTGRGIARRAERHSRVTPRRSRSSGGDTTGLRPDVEEIRYGASVGILASQLLRHCAAPQQHRQPSLSF